ncbi:MAG: ABC transporter permease [Polyangiaceae bacterium]|nr:ABC transporter permease [Polyangiaceae bacterium]
MLALLLGAGHGLENGVDWEFRDDAVTSVWVRSGKTSLPFAGRGPGRDVRFTNDDYEAAGREVPAIEYRSGAFYLWGEFQVRHRNQHSAFDVLGVHPGFRHVEKAEMVRGRFLHDVDLEERRKVAVIGTKVRQSLFGDDDPLGKRIEIRGLAFLVVGEYEDVGGEAELRKIYVPITTAQLLYNSPERIHSLVFTLSNNDLEESRLASESIRLLLARRHDVAPEDRRAIRVHNNLEEYKRLTAVFGWIHVFVWIVALGTLLAGVVGVGNIMLVAVAERTKEIGIRKAIGATPRSIVGMIVCEAVLITAVSGYAGLVAGVLLVEAIANAAIELPLFRNPAVDLRITWIATLILIVCGALAGLFPALRAARVDPIVALREGD